jgi:hypothetical protein
VHDMVHRAIRGLHLKLFSLRVLGWTVVGNQAAEHDDDTQLGCRGCSLKLFI